ncbi:MAG: hypothetical protein IPJ26_12175 [Bacteroidetes bacterium]|nr:hypothetical protein [Bacteroidota bacterium]
MRQNGYDISSRFFGYPESYYTPSMEALSKIEVVRGAPLCSMVRNLADYLTIKLKRNSNKPISLNATNAALTDYSIPTMHWVEPIKSFLIMDFCIIAQQMDGVPTGVQCVYRIFFLQTISLQKNKYRCRKYTRMDYKSQQPGVNRRSIQRESSSIVP